MGKFKEYFERAKSTGLDESIKVPVFESKNAMLEWLEEVAKDVDLNSVMARDDVYDPINEELLIEAGDCLADLKSKLGDGPYEEAYDTELKGARPGWSPLMKQYMRQSSVSPEQRKREKAGDKALWEGERKKYESVANKYLKRLKEVTKDQEEREKDDRMEERERAREEREAEKELRTQFKGMSLKSLESEYRSMGADMAGDFMHDLEGDIKRGTKSVEEAKDEFTSWSQSAAGEAAYSMFEYPMPDAKKELRYLEKIHNITDPEGWAADEIYEGMVKAFEKRSKQWS